MNYKLIKTYPGSPKLGYISKPKTPELLGHYWSGSWFDPADYPEFWEAIMDTEKIKSSLIELKNYLYVKSQRKFNNYIGSLNSDNRNYFLGQKDGYTLIRDKVEQLFKNLLND